MQCDLLETLEGGFAVYGLMWIIIFFMLFIRHLVIHGQTTETPNTNQTGPDDPGNSGKA